MHGAHFRELSMDVGLQLDRHLALTSGEPLSAPREAPLELKSVRLSQLQAGGAVERRLDPGATRWRYLDGVRMRVARIAHPRPVVWLETKRGSPAKSARHSSLAIRPGEMCVRQKIACLASRLKPNPSGQV